jgi:hypothetical protein
MQACCGVSSRRRGLGWQPCLVFNSTLMTMGQQGTPALDLSREHMPWSLFDTLYLTFTLL